MWRDTDRYGYCLVTCALRTVTSGAESISTWQPSQRVSFHTVTLQTTLGVQCLWLPKRDDVPRVWYSGHGIKVKVIFTLEQATKAQRGEKYSSTLSLASALDGGWVVNVTPRPLHPPRKTWCPSLICGNKMPSTCNRGFYCRSYCLLNMFRAPLFPSLGAQEYYTVVAACGISCCGFQVAGLVWSWGLCVRLAFYLHILTTMHGQNHIKYV